MLPTEPEESDLVGTGIAWNWWGGARQESSRTGLPWMREPSSCHRSLRQNSVKRMQKKGEVLSTHSGLLMSFVFETITPSFLCGFLMTASMLFSSSRASSQRYMAWRIIS